MNRVALATAAILTGELAYIAGILCYGLNPHHLGGHLPFLLIVASPALCFALGRLQAIR